MEDDDEVTDGDVWKRMKGNDDYESDERMMKTMKQLEA